MNEKDRFQFISDRPIIIMASEIKASHILVKSEEKAKDIIFKIKELNKNFSELAKEHSICPSGKKCGTLGWFGRGRMVKEFEREAFKGKKGDILGPVKSQFGWHVIKIEDMK